MSPNANARASAKGTVLEVKKLVKEFGGVRAVNGVSFTIQKNELVGLIGPNGSGKTTTINMISGVLKPTSGEIWLRGERIDGLPPYAIAQRRLGRTFQVTQVFRRMTVLENLLVPAFARAGAGAGASVSAQRDGDPRPRALEILRLLRLDHLKNEYAGNLSGGQQKLLELGRVLMLDPEIILLDEPFAGVHPKLKVQLHEVIRAMHQEGRTFLIVSHDLQTVFHLCRRLIVLAEGTKLCEGLPHEIRDDERVAEVYLGR